MNRSPLVRFALLCLLLVGCGDRRLPDDPNVGDDDGDDDSAAPLCQPDGTTRCLDARFDECVDGNWLPQEICAGDRPLCDPVLGCLACAPGGNTCQGDEVWACDGTGLNPTYVTTCAPGDCHEGICADACTFAKSQQSYLGCRFLAVTTLNSTLDAAFHSDFAVVIGAPAAGLAANVTVRRAGLVVAEAVVAAGTSEAILLPMVAELQRPGSLFENAESTTVSGGAYEVETDQPVAAYQFNPLHFDAQGGLLNSHTNDASLLVPEHVLTGQYRVLTHPTFAYAPFVQYRGFVTVVGVEDGTTVSLSLSTDTAPGVPAPAQEGATVEFSLDRGDVVQVLSGASADHDLSGTLVTANRPIATFAGHDCTYLPQESPACDHLEEMALPIETWGAVTAFAAPAHPDSGERSLARYRIMARSDGTALTFDPPVVADTALAGGAWMEFDTDQDFVIIATGPILATQSLLGQDAVGATTGGDPALGTGIPVSQWRDQYDFLTPMTYTSHWLAVTAPAGAALELDGSPLTGLGDIGDGTYTFARVALGEGSHSVRSTDGSRFGITVYGYAPYTSYLYPGGLNLLR